ncbi:MAG: hypothetical protein RSA64_02715, partial [Christensenellaceae bacterium]
AVAKASEDNEAVRASGKQETCGFHSRHLILKTAASFTNPAVSDFSFPMIDCLAPIFSFKAIILYKFYIVRST